MEAYSSIRYQAYKDASTLPDDTFVDEFMADDNKLPFCSKKRQSDGRLLINSSEDGKGTFKEVGEASLLALVPVIQSGNNARQMMDDDEDNEGGKKMKIENAGLCQQPRVQK